MLKIGFTYIFLILITMQCYAQNVYYPNRIWKLTNVNGEFKLKGQYREQYTSFSGFDDTQKSTYFSGGLVLNTKNYIWHPNFMTLDIGGEYSPESDLEDYIVVPDRAEIRTLKGVNLNSTHFANSMVTLSTLFNYNENYSNRENLTSLQTDSKRWGGTLLFKSKILPVSVSYEDVRYVQTEIETDFTYKTTQKNFIIGTKKSFGERDMSELRYTNSDYSRQDYGDYLLQNKTKFISLQNQIDFDSEKKYHFSSFIYNNNQKGNNNMNIFNISEILNLKLPYSLYFNTEYNLYNLNLPGQNTLMNKISGSLNHSLFQSLITGIFYEYSNNNHSFYNETRNTARFNITYTKKIPTGQLNLNYQFMHLYDKMSSNPTPIQILNEYAVLADGIITLLEKPYVDIATVVVHDVTGTIIYRPDFDYILINQGEFTEIQRMPGGQITNETSVYINYMAVQSGSYQYNAISNRVSGTINLFKGLLKIYSTLAFQDYKNVEFSDFLTLNYLKQYFYGSSVDVGFADGGIEFDNYNSSITPYKMTRYFLNVHGEYKEKILLSINGNYRDYNMIDEGVRRTYADLSGNFTYNFTVNSNINLNLGYRNQTGEQNNLDLLTGRTEYKTVFRKLHVIVGLEIYKRNYIDEEINFKGAYVQLARKF